MAATGALIAAPPLLAPSQVGRLLATFPPVDADAHVGLGVTFERDVQVKGTAVWGSGGVSGDPCEVAGSTKTATEISGTGTGLAYTVFQMAKCRMINEWDALDGRLSTLMEVGEQRTIEEAFAASLIAGDYGASAAGITATDAGPRAALAVAEQTIRTLVAAGVILTSPEIVTYLFSRALLDVKGDRIYTKLGTPVVALPGLTDDLYVTGQITVWRGEATDPRVQRAMSVPYTNEFVVLRERVYTIAVEGDASGAMPIVKWTVNLTVDP